ncbi:MAG: metallopeptidase TldD-related protein, partial [Candidatus Thorarchaeota archaeon]
TEGKSYFADKLGDEIATKSLNVLDDGTLPEGLNTTAIDGEGTPSQKTTVVDKGILKNFLNDSYYANIMDSKSTGNSKKSGNPDYEHPPQIGISTITIQPGTKSFEDTVANFENAILVRNFMMGMGHTNPITGNFSIVCPTVYLIEKGEIKNALEPVNVAGNLYHSLKSISNFCSDTFLTPFGVKTPSIVLEGLTVTG